MSHILIVEDEPVIRGALRKLLERHDHSVAEAESVEQAAELDPADFDLVISDLRLPGEPGTELMGRFPTTPVLIMTSYASLRSAVDAMKMGAVDYIAKPFDHDEMVMAVERILKEKHISRHNDVMRADLERNWPVTNIIGDSEPMQALLDQVRRLASTDTTALIRGESGTGKELVARSLHEHSERRSAPIITVNCSAIAAEQIEAELFGVEKGAFEGAQSNQRGLAESADAGTLFLDDVDHLPMDAQARLLRLLEEGEIRRVGSLSGRKINVRIIAATHNDLAACVQRGDFREDLYYRLNVVELRLPPLRERGDDLQKLADAALERACERLGRAGLTISNDARDAMQRYYWPGNVRELENAIERAAILAGDDAISAELLGIDPSAKAPRQVTDPQEELSLEDYFARFVLENQDQMTETELARKLGISRKCLWERRQRLGIPRNKQASSGG